MRTLLLALACCIPALAESNVIGQVFDSEGKDGGVLEFAILKLKNPDDLDGEPIPVKTDRTGRFSVKLAPGPYRLGDIRKPLEKDRRLGEANFSRDLIEIGDDPMYDIGFVKLEKTGSYVSGTVKKAGKPAAGVDVEVFDPGTGCPTGVKARTDASGRYELMMNDVKAARAVFLSVAEAEGRAFGHASVDLWKPGTADIEVPDKWCDLLVDLAAPAETWLYFHPKGESAPFILHKVRAGAKASISGFAPGAWTVTAVCNGAQVDAEATLPAAAPLAVALPAGPRHRVEGTVSISGAPADLDWSTVAVLARPAAGGSAGYLWTSVSRGGAFAFEGLAAGKYELAVAVGKRFDSMRWFDVRRSAVAMPVLELAAPRKVELTVRQSDLRP